MWSGVTVGVKSPVQWCHKAGMPPAITWVCCECHWCHQVRPECRRRYFHIRSFHILPNECNIYLTGISIITGLDSCLHERWIATIEGGSRAGGDVRLSLLDTPAVHISLHTVVSSLLPPNRHRWNPRQITFLLPLLCWLVYEDRHGWGDTFAAS